MGNEDRQLACQRFGLQFGALLALRFLLEREADVTNVVTNQWRQTVSLALLCCASAARPVAAGGQGTPSRAFDAGRAWIVDSTMFEPFGVAETQMLRDALDDETIHEGTPILVLDHPAGRLALLTEQMAYHHAAQGDINGEPWMVSF